MSGKARSRNDPCNLRVEFRGNDSNGRFFTGTSKPIVTVIAEARHASPDPQAPGGDSPAVERGSLWNISKILEDPSLPNYSRAERALDRSEPSGFLGYSPGVSQPGFPAFVESYGTDLSEETVKGGPAYPPFPCPFCDRAYTSWGFRRRHIKAVHTISPSLNCKWCLQVSSHRDLRSVPR